MVGKRFLYLCVVLCIGIFMPHVLLHASVVDGTIDSTYKYAQVLNDGSLLNFGASQGNVEITDTLVSGYVWAANYGWINLQPTNEGITNDSEGNLNGYAWGEKTGWVNFHTTNSQVTIGSDGYFHGYA